MSLGVAYILTRRARRGIAECEHASALDRNLAHADAGIGLGKMFVGLRRLEGPSQRRLLNQENNPTYLDKSRNLCYKLATRRVIGEKHYRLTHVI